MKLVAFLLLSSLLNSYYVNSKSIQPKNAGLKSILNEINEAKEFLESLLTKLDNTTMKEVEKDYLYGISRFTIEMIEVGIVDAIETAEKLSELKELVHQASEIQSGGDDLKDVLEKVKKLKEVVKEQQKYQMTEAIDYVKRFVNVVESMKNTINTNPDNYPELIYQDGEGIVVTIMKKPKYLRYLIKSGYPKIIENLWVAELAVESVKSIHPSEYEQLKRIIRDVEAKIFSMKRETKKIAMLIQIDNHLLKYPEKSENLINLRNNLYQTLDVVYNQYEVFTEDQQEELVDSIIPVAPFLDTLNDQFIEDARNAVELFKSKFPEEAKKVSGYVEVLRNYFDDFILSAKTIAEKIKLDTAEGIRTNPLYIEMFSRITKGKFADVHMTQWGIYKTIEDVIIPLLPKQGEDREVTDEVILQLVESITKYRSDEPGPLDEFMDKCNAGFAKFSPGLFPWEGPYTSYLGVAE